MESRFQREIFKRPPVNIQVDDELARIFRAIDDGYRILILMRGLPGSGKSTLARYVIDRSALDDKRRHVLSADDYFYQRGKYMYDVNKLSDAHSWIQSKMKNLMLQGFSPLIVDNTNCVAWEMHVYMKDAVANGYVIKILEPRTSWSFKTKELTYKNSHNVPLQKIKRMLERYERGLTVESLLRAWNLTYSPEMTPPVLRSSPPINSIPNCSSVTRNDTHDIGNDSLTLMQEKPKPQRNRENVNKQNKKGLLLLNSDISVDWAPIDETFNSWPSEFPLDNFKASSNSATSKCDASTNTCSLDIDDDNRDRYKIIWGFSREINNASAQNVNLSPKFLQTMFDKSTMTDEIYDIWKNMEGTPNAKKYQRELDQLKMLFPDVYLDNLRDVLEHCNGDINLAGNTLLDSEKLIQITKRPEEMTSIDGNEIEDESDEPLDEEFIEINSTEQPSEILNDGCNIKIAEDQTNLKKVIEKNFDFSDDHYSNHVLKIKRRNRGEKPNNSPEITSESPKDEIAECSKNLVDENLEEAVENDNVVSVNVGTQFIEELEKIFDSSYSVSDHLNPIIHMPMSLVHQIHALWLESLYDQIYMQQELSRKFIKEDEEFAKTIELLENSQENIVTVQETPNLQEIMDMEMALALYKADMKKETADNMASRLTHQKLVQLFPGVSSNILKEIHSAHDNKFERTVETLMSSTGLLNNTDSENDKKRAIQEFLMKNERDLLERARKEKERVLNENASILGNSTSSTNNKVTLDLYRQEANRHLQIRNLNYTKAQEYLRKGMTQVASYYSNIASLHTKRHDFATTMVASEMVQMSSSKGDFTLDLHHLNVIEAVKVLDLFVDKHILRIQQEILTKINPGLNTVVKLFLVTGRGRHSPGGQPKIKPAICKRLRERQIKYNEINPGLIGIYLTPENSLNNRNN